MLGVIFICLAELLVKALAVFSLFILWLSLFYGSYCILQWAGLLP